MGDENDSPGAGHDLDAGHPLEARRNDSPPFRALLQARVSRRDMLRGSLGVATGTIFGGAGLSACGGESPDGPSAVLTFGAVSGVAGEDVNGVFLPEGYTWEPLIPWGTGILGDFPEFRSDGSNTAAEQRQQSGEWHDGMKFFPVEGSDTEGVLVVNHENLDPTFFHGFHFDGDGNVVSNREEDKDAGFLTFDPPTNADQVRKEIASHGVSIVPLQRMGGRWRVTDTGLNRRVMADTPMEISGPARGSSVMQTKFSPGGTEARGTLNNCGRGFTPWNTYLACEENFRFYLTTQEDPLPEEKARYLIRSFSLFFWENVAGDPSEENDEFARFDTTPTGNGPTEDFRNEANHFGWIVEIDPFDPSSTPKKRTAMGRFAHEGAQPGLVEPGKPIAFYSGDDEQNEYIYKFVTADPWDPDNPDPDILDRGTLYAARFNDDGTGEWLALDIDDPALASQFSSQAEVLAFARLAADELGATPMDRPEWSTTDPSTGEIYFTLTNNNEKADSSETPNAANPRDPNLWGHVIRHREDDDDPGATTFTWDIFVFGGPAGDPRVNLSGLTENNQFAGPDGLWFDPRGVLWIETDTSASDTPDVAGATNNQLLAVIPGHLREQRSVDPEAAGPAIDPGTQGQLKRFLVGPGGCEVTGIDLSPDAKTLFVNIQHPGFKPGRFFAGNAPTNSFPVPGEVGPSNLPRSTTIAIQRVDGGDIAV